MFERFTRETGDLVVRAADEAAGLAHTRIGTGTCSWPSWPGPIRPARRSWRG